jgi:hypothetical protein
MKETSRREDRVGCPVPIVRRGRWIEPSWLARPMERALGPQMGDFVCAAKERGVVFHLQDTVKASMADEQRSKPFHPFLEWILAAA